MYLANETSHIKVYNIHNNYLPVRASIPVAPTCTPPMHTLSHHHSASAGEGLPASSTAQHAPATLGTCPGAPGEETETWPTVATAVTGNSVQAG